MKKILKKIKIRNLILLIFLLLFNTYAWFIYATRVSMDLNVRVTSWNIEFVSNTGEIVTNFEFDVDEVQPGMEKYEKEVIVNNKGESQATLDYEVESLRIMDEFFEVGNELSSDDIMEMLKNYPFKISIEKRDEGLNIENGVGYFKFIVEWPLDSGNDELDTLWGNKAYQYNLENPTKAAVEMKLKLVASQKIGET